MKALSIMIAMVSTFSLSAQAQHPCGEPRVNVVVKIDHAYSSEYGTTFCYATEVNTTQRFEILDCGYHKVGEVVRGSVFTHWTHKDQQGNPVCDYQTFIPGI